MYINRLAFQCRIPVPVSLLYDSKPLGALWAGGRDRILMFTAKRGNDQSNL